MKHFMKNMYVKLRKKELRKRLLPGILCFCILFLSVYAMYYDFSTLFGREIREYIPSMPNEIRAQDVVMTSMEGMEQGENSTDIISSDGMNDNENENSTQISPEETESPDTETQNTEKTPGEGKNKRKSIMEHQDVLNDLILDEVLLTENNSVPACGTISKDTTWGSGTLSSGTLTVEPGVTLTINGQITVSGNVRIDGGGTIIRGAGAACFKVDSKTELELDNITIDGKSITSSNSMFSGSSCKITVNNSRICNCITSADGGAFWIYGGSNIVLNDTIIEDCEAKRCGGGIALSDTSITINSGTYRRNRTIGGEVKGIGGGFICNGSNTTIIINGGNYLDNSTTSRGGCIYHAGNSGNKTYIYGGCFKGNKSTWTKGSGAIWNSSVVAGDTTMVFAGDAQFCGDGIEGSGTDGIYLDQQNNKPRKIWISDTLSYPINIYVKPVEGYVMAEGLDYTLLHERDMKKIFFVNPTNDSEKWYAVLKKETNQVIVSKINPNYGLFVTYISNGASGTKVRDDTEYQSGWEAEVLPADSLYMEGNYFLQWNTKADGSGTPYQPGDKITMTEDISLYAIFKDGIVASFYSGEDCSSVSVNAEMNLNNKTGTVKTPDLKNMNGWSAVGWDLDEMGYAGNIAEGANQQLSKNTNYYGVYQKEISLNYIVQTEETNTTTDTKAAFANVHTEIGYQYPKFTVASAAVWEDYQFVEWNTRQDGKGTPYQPDDTITLTEDTNLYAIFEKNVTVSFYSGETCTKETETVQIDIASRSGTVTTPVLENMNHWTALGWSTDKDGYVADTEAESNIEVTKDIDFYGIYQRDINLSYEMQGGEENPLQETNTAYANVHEEICYQYPKFTIAPEMTRRGYHFTEWNTKADGIDGDSYEANGIYELTDDTVLYAQWIDDIAPVFLNISYNSGYKNMLDWIIRKKNLVISFPLIEEGSGIKQLNYTLIPEKENSVSGVVMYESIQEAAIDSEQTDNVFFGEINFKETEEYTIAEITVDKDFKGKIMFNCTDNAGNISADTVITADGGVIVEDSAPEITFSSKDGMISDIFQDSMTVDVTVEDNKNESGVTAGISYITYKLDKTEEKRIDNFEHTFISSYEFPVVIQGEGVHVLTVTAVDHAGNECTRDVSIQIHEKHFYRIEYYQQNINDDEYTIVDLEERTGYTDTQVQADVKEYVGFTENHLHELRQVSGTVHSDDSLVLKLYYDRNVYGVTFDLNGAEGVAPAAQTVRYGDFVQRVENPVRRGYTFKGWYLDAEGTTENRWNFAQTVESNTSSNMITLYAKWTDETAPVLEDAVFDSGYDNFFDWIIHKKSVMISVPFIEEGSGAEQAEYILIWDSGDITYGTAEIEPSDTDLFYHNTVTVKASQTKTVAPSGSAHITIDMDFKGIVVLTCTDKAGNISAEKSLTALEGGIIVEDDAPEITFSSKNGDLSEGFTENISVDVQVEDDIDETGISSGIKQVICYIDNEEKQVVDEDYFESDIISDYLFTVDIKKPGTHLLSVTAVDNAGNQNTKQIEIVILKRKEPVEETPDISVTYYYNETPVYYQEEPQTGDSSMQTGVYIVLFIVAGMTYVFLFYSSGEAENTSGLTDRNKNEIIKKIVCWAEKGKILRKLIAVTVISFLLFYYHMMNRQTAGRKGIYEK